MLPVCTTCRMINHLREPHLNTSGSYTTLLSLRKRVSMYEDAEPRKPSKNFLHGSFSKFSTVRSLRDTGQRQSKLSLKAKNSSCRRCSSTSAKRGKGNASRSPVNPIAVRYCLLTITKQLPHRYSNAPQLVPKNGVVPLFKSKDCHPYVMVRPASATVRQAVSACHRQSN